MSSVGLRSEDARQTDGSDAPRHVASNRDNIKSRMSVVPILITLGTVAAAFLLAWTTWQVYMGSPWTRDGTIRAYVVTMAPEVAGRIVKLPVADDQFVHKGDVLFEIDPADYRIALEQAQAQAERDGAALKAQLDLSRTVIRSPVNGYVTNLLAQLGDYATVGQKLISVVDTDSFWVDGYFEETSLGRIHEGYPATVKLMGYTQLVRGHVGGIARGINVPNAQPDQAGLASVNPIFTWVRLAQRVPVRIHIDQVPDGVRLVAGITATVQIDPSPRAPPR